MFHYCYSRFKFVSEPGENVNANRRPAGRVTDTAASSDKRDSGAVMGTVDRALRLLRHFSVQEPELRLSELARRAGYDKTTTLRCLNALARNGFVERQPETGKYRLGIAPVSLARIREQSFPLQRMLQPVLDRLSEAHRETTHASLLCAGSLVNVAVSDPRRAARVFVDPSTPLPMHATASGQAVLAFVAPERRSALGLGGRLERFTEYTTVDSAELESRLERVAATGCSVADRSFDREVVGVGAPLIGKSGEAVGAIAVAAFAARCSDAGIRRMAQAVTASAREVSQQIGGSMRAA